VDLLELEPFIDKASMQTICDANKKLNNKGFIKTQHDLISMLHVEPTIEAIFFYRLERLLYLHFPESPLLPYLASTMRRRTGMEIYYSTAIGEGFSIQHGFGVVIGPRFTIGRDFSIYQGVTLGQRRSNSPTDTITIGNNVTIFANATVIGNVTIGDNSTIAANSVVIDSVESNSVYGGIPARRLK